MVHRRTGLTKNIAENMRCSPTAEQEPLFAELRSYNFLELVVGDWLAPKKVSEGEDARKYGCLAATLKPMLNI